MVENGTAESMRGKEEEPPLWLQAQPADVEGLDFEAPIVASDCADCRELSTAFRKASELHKLLGDKSAEPAARVFDLLSAVTNFHFKPADRNEPFGPMMVMDGRRTAIPADFRGNSVNALAVAAELAANPALKARLCDTCWLLERNRHELGRAAIAAYVEIIEGLDSGKLRDRLDRDDPVLGLTARDAMKRALTISRHFEESSAEVGRAREWLVAMRARSIANGKPVPVHWFFEMDLDFGVSEPSELAAEIEDFVANHVAEGNSHIIVDLWRLAARAYHVARDDDGNSRCRVAAAETLVANSEQQSSATLASHWLGAAIAEYHGLPGTRERRTELRHRLIDVQFGISDEMSTFSQPVDLKAIIEEVKGQLAKRIELADLLFLFADLDRSPQPEKLAADAVRSIREFPLSSIFGASFHDHEGKVVHRAGGAHLGDGDNEEAIRTQIAQHESIRRMLHVSGQVEVARQHIIDSHYIGEDTFNALLRHSPFVPNDLTSTYSRAFQRFFEGDYASALYILTPMLENSLRHVLKMAGHDVTNFDDARQVQQDRTISGLFDQMRGQLEETFGKAIIADIDRVFLSKPGPTIRHDVAHGLLHDSSPYGADAIYACWLIFRLCCIPLFGHRDEITLPS